jgi:hypothetical protein
LTPLKKGVDGVGQTTTSLSILSSVRLRIKKINRVATPFFGRRLNSPFWGALLQGLALAHACEETIGVKVSYDTFNRVLSKIVLRQTVTVYEIRWDSEGG